MSQNGLTLSVNKTVTVIRTNKSVYPEPNFRLNYIVIRPCKQITYLGIETRRRLGFRSHLEAAAAKTANVLAQILPNIDGDI